jgi:hypothetical protein
MSVSCTFLLNRRENSYLTCPGVGSVVAFSGHDVGRNNPDDVSLVDIGPIPRGTYYLLDRQSGGYLGHLYELWDAYGYGTTDRRKWFMLWNPRSGDTTMIEGVKRGSFRLHPMGPLRLSDGCITVLNPQDFERLQAHIRLRQPSISVPGAPMKAYGTVSVL